jgi:hypothetical protein
MKKFCTTMTLALALLGAAQADDASMGAPSAAMSTVLSQYSAKHLVMLYRKETDAAPSRLDPTIQATSAALQHEFLDRHFKLTQPSPDALAALDHGPDVIVTFAPDAGMSMIYSVYSDLRPMGAPDMGIAEIRISAQVFIGSSILSTEEGRGQLQTRTDAPSASYGVRRAYETAAKDAASDLADHIEARLKDLTPADIAQMVQADTTTETVFTIVSPVASNSSGSGASSSPATAPTATAPPATQPPAVPPAATPPAPAAVAPPADAGAPSPSPPPAAAPPPAATPHTPAADSVSPSIGKRWLLAVAVGDVSKVIGIRHAGDPSNNLPGPATDLKNIQSGLREMGFDESTTVALLDQAATTAAVTQALEHFRQVVQPNDEFVFFISGHGLQMRWARTGRTLPLLYDTNANDSEVLDFGRIATLIGAIPARQTVMLIDTCHAGAATSSLDSVVISSRGVQAAKTGGAPELGVMLRGVKGTNGDMAVFSAARADETAIDRGPVVGGLFTSEFLKALKVTHGQAPLQEVYSSYVLPNVTDFCAKRTDCHQTPVLGYDGSGNLIRIAGTQTTRAVQAAPAAPKKAKKSSTKYAQQTS